MSAKDQDVFGLYREKDLTQVCRPFLSGMGKSWARKASAFENRVKRS